MLAILDPRGRRRLPRLQAAGVAACVLALTALVAASAPAPRTALAGGIAVEIGDRDDRPAAAEAERRVSRPLAPEASTPTERESRYAGAVPPTPAPSHTPPTDTLRGAEVARSAFEEGIASLATAVAEATTDVTLGTLRQIGIPVAADEPRGSRRASQDPRETALLISALRTNSDASVRRTAAWGLHRRTSGDAADALRDALLGDRSAEVRETAAWALAHRGDARNAEALAHAASRDAASEVRATAAWGLGHMRARQHADVLVPALSAPDAATRMTAAWSMGQMRPRSAPAQLIALVSDPHAQVQEAAAWALGEIRDPAAMQPLLRALDAGPGKGARDAVLRAIVLTAAGDAAALEQLAGSPHADLQERSIRAIARGGADSWPWPWPWPRPRPAP